MTPLQLSSTALKQSSGPVGVQACRSAVPAGGVTWDTTTSLPGAFAAVFGSAQETSVNREKATSLILSRHETRSAHAGRRLVLLLRFGRLGNALRGGFRIHDFEERLPSQVPEGARLGSQRHQHTLFLGELQHTYRFGSFDKVVAFRILIQPIAQLDACHRVRAVVDFNRLDQIASQDKARPVLKLSVHLHVCDGLCVVYPSSEVAAVVVALAPIPEGLV